MLRTITLTLALTPASSTVFAEPASKDSSDTLEFRQKLAEEILEVTKSRELIENSFTQTQDIMLKDMPVEMKDSTMKVMRNVMAWDKISGKFTKIYTDVYTAKELQEISAFYRSPMGKNMIEKQPEIALKTGLMIQEIMKEAIPLLQAEMKKSMPASSPSKTPDTTEQN